ncbi:MAG: Zn-dependent hydrolase [Bacteroidales bacterium]|nr:Zn-dependent hydrolase [Bacteroidales bacterium]MBP5613004.1 Zn-dependent hydrolase [Bacteroidales bacterium]
MLTYCLLVTFACMACTGCKKKAAEAPQQPESPCKAMVEEYAWFDLTSDLVAGLSENEKQLIPIFVRISEIMDDLFWKQTFGDKSLLDTISDEYAKEFAMIQYGPWNRLDANKPFVSGYGEKRLGCCYYPDDITAEEYEAFENADKGSLYTVLRRDDEGKLKSVWYHEEYAAEIGEVCRLLDSAAQLAEDPGMKKYLTERKKAFETDDYLASDLAWMDMKNGRLDFVVGPIENYDDNLNNAKASYEAFIVLKDVERSKELAKFVGMLPGLQKELPCDPKYKTFKPGTSSDMNVYDAVYYAGDCNAGSKTIAINLPNDDRVQAKKGTRRLQLRNAMQAKFEKIMMPIGKLILDEDALQHLKFDAFFWNVTFHEVAHGLGIKETVNGKGSVDEAMKTQRSNWEEAKADILGLFLVCRLIEKGEITNITEEDAITTYIAGLFRSVRFGAGEAHGIANAMCFNYMYAQGAFTRDENGVYHIDYAKAKAAMESWAGVILATQGEGDFRFAEKFAKENGVIKPEMQQDIDRINNSGVPRDIRFREGLDVLGLK